MRSVWRLAVICFFVFVLGIFAYNALFFAKALPNTYLIGQGISGKDEAEIEDIVSQAIGDFSRERITLYTGYREVEASLGELGVEFDVGKTADAALAKSRSGGFLADQLEKVKALFLKEAVRPYYTIQADTFDKFLGDNLAGLEKFAVNPTVIFVGAKPQIKIGSGGVIVDRVRLVSDLENRLNNFSSSPIALLYVEDLPQVSDEAAVQAQDAAQLLAGQAITLTYGSDRWPLSGKKLFDLLEFVPKGESNERFASVHLGQTDLSLRVANDEAGKGARLDVNLRNDAFAVLVEEIGSIVNQATVDATLELAGNKVTKFTPAQDGQELDKERTKALLLEKISLDNLVANSKISVELPVKVTKARIANSEVESLGIKELLGSGVSYFAGSIANRAHNIGLGASLITGSIVAPGETFSFNALVGPVSAEQGFKEAYIIQKGRTVLDDGGGICQVSTTVFRAALNSGLPIVKRTAHAYRVSYYEQRGFKPGFDATIFSPSVDLQFKNDTATHILVQAKVDRANTRIQVDVYGTSDGRRVEISDSVVSNITAAPEPKYEDDPTLPRGTTKQVDFAAQGATAVFTRKVYKGDEQILDDTFKSNFRPWQAVYLVGTGG